MGGSVTAITSAADFETIINSGKPVVIDFWATWCGPCKTISPVFEKLAKKDEHKDVEFYKVDVDEQEEIAAKVGIRAMPTFQLFKDGEKVDQVVGASPTDVEALIVQGVSLV